MHARAATQGSQSRLVLHARGAIHADDDRVFSLQARVLCEHRLCEAGPASALGQPAQRRPPQAHRCSRAASAARSRFAALRRGSARRASATRWGHRASRTHTHTGAATRTPRRGDPLCCRQRAAHHLQRVVKSSGRQASDEPSAPRVAACAAGAPHERIRARLAPRGNIIIPEKLKRPRAACAPFSMVTAA